MPVRARRTRHWFPSRSRLAKIERTSAASSSAALNVAPRTARVSAVIAAPSVSCAPRPHRPWNRTGELTKGEDPTGGRLKHGCAACDAPRPFGPIHLAPSTPSPLRKPLQPSRAARRRQTAIELNKLRCPFAGFSGLRCGIASAHLSPPAFPTPSPSAGKRPGCDTWGAFDSANGVPSATPDTCEAKHGACSAVNPRALKS